MLKQGDSIVTDIRLGGVQINTVYLGAEKVYPGLLRRDVGVHYDTGANTYQGWDRYNIYYYRDVLVWSNGTQTYENLRTENTLTRANAYTEAGTLKSVGTSYWRNGWDKYRTDTWQTLRTREDGHAEWVGETWRADMLEQSNAYTEAGTLKSVGTSYWRNGWDKYRTDTWQTLRTAFDGYQEWVGETWRADMLEQSNAYTLGGYYHESSSATVCINYGVAPYSTGYHRILARNRIRFDGYQEVNDRYTESNWQIVANNVVACGYNPIKYCTIMIDGARDGYIRVAYSGEFPPTAVSINVTIRRPDQYDDQYNIKLTKSSEDQIVLSGIDLGSTITSASVDPTVWENYRLSVDY